NLGYEVVPLFLRHIEARGIFVLQLGPGHCFGIAAENDVGATPGHIRSDRDSRFATCLSNNLGLALVVLGVKNLVLDAALIEQIRYTLALFDRHGADKHRSAAT